MASPLSYILDLLGVKKLYIGGSAQTYRNGLDLIAGSGVTLTPADDAAADTLRVTVAASGGASLPSPTGNALEVLRVNAAADGYETVTPPILDTTLHGPNGSVATWTQLVVGSTIAIPDGWHVIAYSVVGVIGGSAVGRFVSGALVEVSAGEATAPGSVMTVLEGGYIGIPFGTSPQWRADSIAGPTWTNGTVGGDFAVADGWYRVAAATCTAPAGAATPTDISAYPDYAYARVASSKIVELQGPLNAPLAQTFSISQIRPVDGGSPTSVSGAAAVWSLAPHALHAYPAGLTLRSTKSGKWFKRSTSNWE